MHGTVNGKRRRGRQGKRWEGNMQVWTGMDFASSTSATLKGQAGKGSVMPQLPS